MRIVKGLELNGKKLEKLLMRQMCTTTSTISKMVNPRASSIVVNSKTQTQFVAPNLWHFSDSLQAYLWGKDYVRISNSIGNGKFKLLRRDAVDEILDHYRQVSGSSTSDGSDTSPSRHVSPRYILYSKECYTGKRMCLVTLLDHYLTQDDFIILYINWIPEILVVHGKVVKVTDDVIDLPERSAKILTHFSELNKKFIESSTTIRDFEWNGVRVVEKGESLKLLVERSLENPTSCQKCIEELIYTAMYLSNLENSKYKFAVFICGLNYIFNDKDIRIGRTERFSIQSVSIIKMIKSLFTTFWVIINYI
ncbi:MAG: 28S ribosomal protein S29, mitochondrial, variant 2 [Marteilia pararefringens]